MIKFAAAGARTSLLERPMLWRDILHASSQDRFISGLMHGKLHVLVLGNPGKCPYANLQ